MPENYKDIITEIYDTRSTLNSDKIRVIRKVIGKLDSGELRIVNKIDHDYQINLWLKKAILLYFASEKNFLTDGMFFDKIASKFQSWNKEQFLSSKIRVLPGARVRYGAYIGKNVILMPSFINIGAYVDDGCLIDSWATVGSCAQIGKNVHISGGAGIGGVLEPVGNKPVIIEDNCFIGARSEIAEGVKIGQGSVIAMGVYLSASTKIIDRNSSKIYVGEVPSKSVVVPGSYKINDKLSVYCGIIIKQVDGGTKSKTELSEILRGQ